MEQKIIELLSEHFGTPVAEITPSMELHKDFNATDLELADFLQVVEQTFKITISQGDVSEIRTVEDLIGYITDHAEETT